LQFGGKTTVKMASKGKAPTHCEARLWVLESFVEQCREWRAEWKAGNQEMESKWEFF